MVLYLRMSLIEAHEFDHLLSDLATRQCLTVMRGFRLVRRRCVPRAVSQYT